MADPVYRQIAEDLRAKIESGEIEPGSQLPTEIELREQYENASRNTIRDAIRLLAIRGLVTTQPGRGTFVVEKITRFIVPLTPSDVGPGSDSGVAFEDVARQQGAEPDLTAPRIEVQQAKDEIARELGIEVGSSVVSRHQERRIDGSPSSLQTSFYPMEFVQRGAVELLQAVDIKQGATQYLQKTLNIRQVAYREKLTVRPPNQGEIDFFKFSNISAVLVVVINRTAYAEGGKRIRYTVTVYPADRNDFVIDFGDDVPPLFEGRPRSP